MSQSKISMNKRFRIGRVFGVFSALALALVILVGLIGCSGLNTTEQDIHSLAFNIYQQQTISDVKAHRVFQQMAQEDELC